jgi:hypothetical protein
VGTYVKAHARCLTVVRRASFIAIDKNILLITYSSKKAFPILILVGHSYLGGIWTGDLTKP